MTAGSAPVHLQGGGGANAVPLRAVTQLSGQTIDVQGDDERDWFNKQRDAYINQLRPEVVSDEQDLDRLLIMELMVHRWTRHLASGLDYEGQLVSEDQLRKNIREYSVELGKLKEAMGLSKGARDRESAGSVAGYIARVKQAAKAFGVHREHQLDKALTLTHELFAMVGAWERSDDEERRKLDLSPETIVQWVSEVMKAEFDEIDQHFRANQQRYWVRDL